MKKYDLTDKYGRLTLFTGELLVQDSTSHSPDKPTWTETSIYRTAGGAYVLDTWNRSRYFHASRNCSRLRDRTVEPVTQTDTWVCNKCVPENHSLRGGYREADRHSVTVCDGPEELIVALSTVDQRTGLPTHGSFSQKLLRDVSMVDEKVASTWMIRDVN
jgi:hypothetical protein